jgi:superfamily I DNA/RNA helicase
MGDVIIIPDEVKDIITKQQEQRKECLERIINSSSPKRLIVAGPGTGKTFTFRKILENKKDGNNLVLTFIRKLRDDMITALSEHAEVKTFHQYCKKVLHHQNGRVDIFPWLTQIVKMDAFILRLKYADFDKKFRTLDTSTGEIDFYLARGDYYESVCFDDSVYRLFVQLIKNPEIVSEYDQILVDEYQDFNPLEVAFINALESRGPILIVGDDDQAIYDKRSASPLFLREKHKSTDYEKHILPFCNRCPKVIVDATNALIREGLKYGYLKGRIDKPFECYLDHKYKDSVKYPKIFTVRCTLAKTIADYIKPWINDISADDVAESWKEGEEYPTVLIIGPRHYLSQVIDSLKEDFPQLEYEQKEDLELSAIYGYSELLLKKDSNLGWRILAEFLLERSQFKKAVRDSISGTKFVSLLPVEFVKRQKRVLEIIQILQELEVVTQEIMDELQLLIGELHVSLINRFIKKPQEDASVIDKTKPSILMTSFNGCKGLSGGHVFIIGANNGIIPKDVNSIEDIEFSRFLVALTRTRKCCHIIASKWFDKSVNKQGKYLPSFEKSIFTGFIDSSLKEDFGDLKVSEIREIFKASV